MFLLAFLKSYHLLIFLQFQKNLKLKILQKLKFLQSLSLIDDWTSFKLNMIFLCHLFFICSITLIIMERCLKNPNVKRFIHILVFELVFLLWPLLHYLSNNVSHFQLILLLVCEWRISESILVERHFRTLSTLYCQIACF